MLSENRIKLENNSRKISAKSENIWKLTMHSSKPQCQRGNYHGNQKKNTVNKNKSKTYQIEED